jgi:hypothetical protein
MGYGISPWHLSRADPDCFLKDQSCIADANNEVRDSPRFPVCAGTTAHDIELN